MMRIRLVGAEAAEETLKRIGKKIDPLIRGAVNTTATQVRKQRFNAPLRAAFPSGFINKGIVIKRANSKRRDARLIPSSSGVNVTQYKKWTYIRIDRTRARIVVTGPYGRKLAAGFVNPEGRKRLPLSTRSSKARVLKNPSKNRSPHIKAYVYSHPLQEAMGPSLAYWFKVLATSTTIRWTNVFLQQELWRRVRRELAKYN